MPYAIQLANALSRYPLKEVLCAPYFTPDYKPELVLELMKFISINNFTIMLVSKSFEGLVHSTFAMNTVSVSKVIIFR